MPGADLALTSPGGMVLIVLAVLSVLSIALMVAKALQLARARGGQAGRDAALVQWSKGERDPAVSALSGDRTPAGRVLHYALKATIGKMPRKPLEAELMRQGNAEVEAMNRNIRLLELIAMIAPLLGLLGTVLGMIQSFQQLEMAQGAANASVLAGGIWQALLTTAAGLVVAIPAAVGATLLAARVDGAAHDIEAAVGQFFLLEDTGTRSP
ncbi:MotA/TolQ/ExbB proton channel family protein [Pseudooceanicola sp.]|uniref:MotA/TolQ/ExbB proton channel family protein n=1 Tax=Pseudooceanicola sp. TaxID=1914328 RepID=UPI0035C6DA6E